MKNKETKKEVSTKESADKAIKQRMYVHLSVSAKAKEQKKFRSKARRNLQKRIDIILLSNKQNKNDECKKAVKEFIAYYKKNYILNDFSLASIYAGSKEIKVSEYNEVLKIVKRLMK